MKSSLQILAWRSLSILFALTLAYRAIAHEPDGETLLRVKNPDSTRLPTLSVWKTPHGEHYVAADFPEVKGFICDSWCYESDFDFLSCTDRGEGRLELRHRDRSTKVLLVTIFFVEPGAVEVVCRALLDGEGPVQWPDALPSPNLCWQLRRALGFTSREAPYPEFVKRCFLFTPLGRTFMHETVRSPIPVRAKTDPLNNPPWVQMYVSIAKPVPISSPTEWAGYSSDRFVVPICGTVSRDGKYLAALVNDSATSMAQAWHDCLHNNPLWKPADAPPGERRWRLKMYLMANQPDKLLARAAKDFNSLYSRGWQLTGVEENLPVFLDQLKDRQRYPLSWLNSHEIEFPAWKIAARKRVFESLLASPPQDPV